MKGANGKAATLYYNAQADRASKKLAAKGVVLSAKDLSQVRPVFIATSEI